jgi:hypothetical protein
MRSHLRSIDSLQRRNWIVKNLFVLASFVLTIVPGCTWAQAATPQPQEESFLSEWLQQSSRAAATQPQWIAPMFTVTGRLLQQFRYDIGWQTQGNATTTNYGTGRGLELIPAKHTEVLISAPPYVTHDSPRLRDGFGDMVFLFKYRVAAGTEHQGNYVVTAFLSTTLPTGTYSNGGTHASFSPTLALGKGWGNFDIQSTAGVTLPTGGIDVLGTPIGLNATAQYRILGRLWPEMEVNSTFWENGRNAGKKQVLLSPGLVVGRLLLWKRLGFAIGTGVQIAATSFHTYNHNWVLSVRFPF